MHRQNLNMEGFPGMGKLRKVPGNKVYGHMKLVPKPLSWWVIISSQRI
ncbi:MAG: hypothetical protein KAJ19_20480 [Gammaproteobacteria bacterium]|nr:hypothetical protein [Gammaproteobacteria bacterium]